MCCIINSKNGGKKKSVFASGTHFIKCLWLKKGKLRD
jgi:hypothetical protein